MQDRGLEKKALHRLEGTLEMYRGPIQCLDECWSVYVRGASPGREETVGNQQVGQGWGTTRAGNRSCSLSPSWEDCIKGVLAFQK